MHRRLVTSFASIMGAAALVATPLALVAPAAQAAPVVSAVIPPDETWDFDEDYNHEEFWEQFLAEEEDIDALCVKEEPVSDPYTIPEISELFDVPEDVEAAYVLAVVKGGADQDDNDAIELYWEPEAGDQLSHATKTNSFVILCIAELEDETSTPTPSKTPTGPVVETDGVAPAGSPNVLAPIAAGAILAGAGALLLGRHRQGTHR